MYVDCPIYIHVISLILYKYKWSIRGFKLRDESDYNDQLSFKHDFLVHIYIYVYI